MKENLKKGEKVAIHITLATLGLAILKGIVGLISGSLILIADAFHSGSDTIPRFASWFGLKISGREANKKFPYGYYKAENLMTLVIVGFIFYAAYEIFMESYNNFFEISQISFPLIAMAVPLISAAVSYGLKIYASRAGEEISSQSLIANAQDLKADTYSSLLIFVGIILSYFRVGYIESIIGIILSFMILKIGLETIKPAIYSLMDANPDPGLEKDIRKIIRSVPGARGIKDLKLRQSGVFMFGEAKLMVSRNIDVKRAHEISDNTEAKIKQKHPKIESFLLHIEPFDKKVQKVLVPISSDKGLDSEVIGHFGRANKFLFAVLDGKDIRSWRIKDNPYTKKKMRAGLAAAKYVLSEKIDTIVLKKVGEISFHALRDGYVDIYLTQGKTAKEVLDYLKQNKLKKLDKPTHSSDK